MIDTIINQCAEQELPLKMISNTRKKSLPWFNGEVKKVWKKKNKWYKKYKSNKDQNPYRAYKQFRLKFKDVLRKEESNHYKKFFDKCRNNPKKIWNFNNSFTKNETNNEMEMNQRF